MSVQSEPVPYQGAGTEAIEFHYDISNEYYRLFLDSNSAYSCALWDGEDDTLDAAQARKLDYLVDATRAAGKDRVLDVGCGWGALLRRLVDHHGAGRAVGLTLSPAQVDHVSTQGDPRIEIRLEGWADHQPAEGYDAIITMGAFEHFARPGLNRTERVANYRRFFQLCRSWLPDGGRLAVQTMTKGSNVRLDRQTLADLKFVANHIFPDSEIPWPSEVLEASERRFELVALRSDAAHYVRTCRTWLQRLRDCRAEAVALVGEAKADDYERYFEVCANHFKAGHYNLMRFVFETR